MPAIRLRVLAFLSLPLLALAQDLLICPACRREAPPGSMFCPKCGAAISGDAQPQADHGKTPEPPAAAPVSAATATPAAASADIGKLAAEGVRACAQVGMRQLQGGRPDIARALFDNALALASLHPDALTPEQGQKLQEETRRCDDLLSTILAVCPACQGSGHASMNVTSLGGPAGAAQSKVTSGTPCGTCGGSGRMKRRRTVAERKTAQSNGAKGSETAFHSLGYTQEGNVWISPALASALDVRLRCRLRHAAASPCAQCLGIGLEDCRKCGATGYVPCKAKGCQKGWIVEDSLNRLDSKSATLKKRIPCPECGGSAKVPCAVCQGRGATLCARCSGSGKRATCTSCGGDGYAPCKTCDGTGKTKKRGQKSDASPDEPCAACGGEGITFCRACHGDGHAAR